MSKKIVFGILIVVVEDPAVPTSTLIRLYLFFSPSFFLLRHRDIRDAAAAKVSA